MSAMPNAGERLEMSDLKRWDRDVAKALTILVNDYGVGFRVDRTSNHIYLYTGDDGRPWKAAVNRPKEVQLHYIEKFARERVAPMLSKQGAEALAARFNDPTKKAKKPISRPAASEPAPEPTPQPSAPEPSTSPAPQPDPGGANPIPFSGEAAPEGYEQWFNNRNKTTNWWKKIGVNEWQCKTCPYVYQGIYLVGAHQRVHRPEANAKVMNAVKAVNAQERAEKAARTRKIRKAIRLLSEATGVDVSADAAKLEQQLAKVTAERDELRARLDLMREAMRA